MSVYLAYRQRVEKYKGQVYDLQVKGILEIFQHLVAVQQIIDEYHLLLREEGGLLGDREFSEKFSEEVSPAKNRLKNTVLKYAPIISAALFSALIDYIMHIELIIGEVVTQPDSFGIGRYEAINAPWNRFAWEFVNVVVLARKFLGTEPLQKAIASTVGEEDLDWERDEQKERVWQLLRLLQKDYDLSKYL